MLSHRRSGRPSCRRGRDEAGIGGLEKPAEQEDHRPLREAELEERRFVALRLDQPGDRIHREG